MRVGPQLFDEFYGGYTLQGDQSGWLEPPVDLDLVCSAILPGLYVATVAAHQLPELSELSQREVITVLSGPPVGILSDSILYWV